MDQTIRFDLDDRSTAEGEPPGITMSMLGSKPFILIEFEKDANNDVDVEIVIGGKEVSYVKWQTLLGYVIQGLEEVDE